MKLTMKRVVSFILALVMVFSLFPQITPQAQAADFKTGSGYDPIDSNGYPTSSNGPVVLALCFMGDTFPGEPATHSSGNYLRYGLTFERTNDYFSGDEVLQNVIGADGYVMGSYSSSWGSESSVSGIFDPNGLDDEHFTQKFNDALAEHEQDMIADVIAAKQDKNQKVGSTNPADYEIVWYIIKYQYSGSSWYSKSGEWHVNGLIREKDKYSVVYDANGATTGAPPNGVIDMSYSSAQNYKVQSNTGGLSRGNQYNFIGWNTKADGSGTFFSAGAVADLTVLGENPITLYAQWAEKNKVKVNWYDGDGKIIHVDSDLVSGDKVTIYDGVIPTKQPTTNNLYTFNNVWKDKNGNVVTLPITMGNQDINLYAQFNTSPRTYSVTWVNQTVIETDAGISYGDKVSYGGSVPVRNTTETEGYLFIGWSTQENGTVEYGLRDEIAVKSDMTLHAQFQRVPLRTVNWHSENGSTLLATQRVLEGDTATYPNATPTKAGYAFKGWATSAGGPVAYAAGKGIKVSGNMDLYAVFEPNKYTVTWVNWDNTVLETDKNVSYGTMPSYNGVTPTKASEVDQVFQFIGWTPEVNTVNGDITYKAAFSSAVREYTVTWNNYDNTLIKKDQVKYGVVPYYTGTTPVRPETDTDTFTFIGWTPAASKVRGDVTYTATFRAEPKLFTATVKVWKNPVVNSSTGAVTNGTLTDLADIASYTELYLRDVSDHSKIYPMEKTAKGTYTAELEDGSYDVVTLKDGDYERVIEERIVLPMDTTSGDPDSTTADILFYSVTYKFDGGEVDGQTSIVEYYQRGSEVLVSDYAPEREQYAFTNTWQLDTNTTDSYQKGQRITVLGSGIIRPHTLTAKWLRTNDNVVINLTIHHHSDPEQTNSVGMNPAPGSVPIALNLTHRAAGSDVYVQQGSSYTVAAGWVTNANTVSKSALASGKGYATKTTTLSFSSNVTGFKQLSHDASYSANILLDDYFLVERSVTETVDPITGDVTYTVNATLQYRPDLFQLNYTVKIDGSVPGELEPSAVDLKILSYKDGAWSPISRHVESSVEARFEGSRSVTGSYGVPVKNQQDEDFFYHIAVAGFTLADGTQLGSSVGAVTLVDYKSNPTDGSAVYQYAVGAYTAVVTVVSDRTAADGTKGVYGVGNSQAAGTSVTVTVYANPHTVTLDPNGGMLSGSTNATVLNNQFRIPVLGTYTPTRAGGYVFDGWRLPNGELATVGTPITENVTLVAKWKEPLIVSGEVRIEDEDSSGTALLFESLPTSLTVTLEKTAPGGDKIIAQSKTYTLTEADYATGFGVVPYAFDPVEQDGSSYQVFINVTNYDTSFLNEPGSNTATAADLRLQSSYTGTRAAVDSNHDNTARVYAYLLFNPQDFDLTWKVDASAIGADFRPDSLDFLVRFNGEHDASTLLDDWKIIVQHYSGGIYKPENTVLGADGTATDAFPVWNVDPRGDIYDYALKIHKWVKDGVKYDLGSEDPFAVTLNPAIAWFNGTKQVTTDPTQDQLVVTLTPKTYTITYELNAGEDPVMGLFGEPTSHTWSYKTTDIPVNLSRDGYDFLGWQANVSGYQVETVDGQQMGTISADTAGDITLTAQWRKQKQVTFRVENGTWSDGETENITVLLSLDEHGNAVVSLPTGMIANYGYGNGSWSGGLSGDTAILNGDSAAVYTFSFQRIYHAVTYEPYAGSDSTGQDTVAHGNYIRVEPSGGIWNGSSAVQDILMEAAEDLEDPTRVGYVFVGWNRTFVEETISGGVVTHRYQARWLLDENHDGIADIQQKKIVFRIQNGTWDGTSSSDIAIYVNLDSTGKADITELIPTGMQPRVGFLAENAFWSPSLPAGNIVTGLNMQVYTYNHYTTVTYFDQLEEGSDFVTILPGNFIQVNPNGGSWNGTTASSNVMVTGAYTLDDAVYTNHTFLGWSVAVGENPINYIFTAQWKKDAYTITWKNENGTVLETDEKVELGTMPEYNGAAPTKPSTAEFDYTFKGWTPKVVAAEAHATYTAQFTATRRVYTVTWLDWNGDTLDTDALEYGKVPAYAGDPTRGNTAEFTYAFTGWWHDADADGVQDAGEFYAKDSALPAVKGNISYKAVYTETTNKYNVTWLDEDGTKLKSELVEFGKMPTAPADPTKAATAQYTYTFSGWTPTVSSVTGDVTYRAGYTATVNKYTVTWYAEDGSTVIATEQVEYGQRPTVPGNPVKPSDAQHTYTFSGWKKGEFVYIPESVPTVTGDVSYTAQFSQTTNKYMVTWQNFDGTILEQDKLVEYGTKPSFSSTSKLTTEDPNNDFEFLGWYLSGDADQKVVNLASQTVTGDVTYVAKYKITSKARLVTIHVWVNASSSDGTGGTPATIGTVTNAARENIYLAPKASADDPATFIRIPWDNTAQAYTAMLMPGDYQIFAGNTAAEAVREANQIVSVDHTNVSIHTLYNSVTYDAGSGSFGGERTFVEYYKSGAGPVYVTKKLPAYAGHVFTHWHDEADNNINASTDGVPVKLTDAIVKGYTLTAHWSAAEDITVVVKIGTRADNDYVDPGFATKTLSLQLASKENGSTGPYVPIFGSDKTSSYSASDAAWSVSGDTYTYTYKYTNQPGDYLFDATALMPGYARTGSEVSADGNTVTVHLQYDPDGFDLSFLVVVDGNVPDELVPRAVDVQIVYFERTDKNGNGQWKIIPNSEGKAIEVALNKVDGIWMGTGTYHVWSEYTSAGLEGELYLYRIAITDFDLGPSRGTLSAVSAAGEKAFKLYSSVAGSYHPAGAYTADVAVVDLNCENGLAGGLLGAHDSSGTQHGTITAVIGANPYTVVQHYEDDTTPNKTTKAFLTPVLGQPTRSGYTFAGWWTKDAGGNWDREISGAGTAVMNLISGGTTLDLYARWKADLTVSGDVTVSNLYGDDVIHEPDRPDTVKVELLNADTNAVLKSQVVNLTDDASDEFRTGTYEFKNVADNGANYRVAVVAMNFEQKYRNETVSEFGANHYAAVDANADSVAEVDISMAFEPHTFALEYTVDASAIGEGFRPTSAGIVVKGATNSVDWNIIAQQLQGGVVDAHDVSIDPETGKPVADAHGGATSIWHHYDVWRRSSHGELYGYTIQLWNLTFFGKSYTHEQLEAAPFTMIYRPAYAWYDTATGEATTPQTKLSDDVTLTHPDPSNPHGLVAYLIPKTFTVTYELGRTGTVAGATKIDGNTAQQSFLWSHGLGTLPDAVPTASTGVSFAGWWTKDADGNWDEQYTSIAASRESSVILYARWNYTITWNSANGSEPISQIVLEGTMPTAPADPSKEANDQYTYTFTGWSPAVSVVTGNRTYTAQYSNATNLYKVTWKNHDGTELGSNMVEYGAMPAYTGAVPTKASTEQYRYTFSGWTPAVAAVTGEAVYTATFTETLRSYTVLWKNHDGTTLSTDTNVNYGVQPLYDGQTPVKTGDAQYTHTFIGWKKAGDDTLYTTATVPTVTGDTTYTAQFETSVNSYTVTWKNWDGTVLETDTLTYGTMPTFDGTEPSREQTVQIQYVFSGWDKEVAKVTGNVTYTAEFAMVTRTYQVVWKNWDGSVLETDPTAPYGQMPQYNGKTPAKAATAQFTYTFDKWDPVVSVVTGDVIYTATFTAKVNEYLITWKDDDGTVLKSAKLAYGLMPNYGEDPSKPATAQYTYTFSGWTPAVEKVSGTATYTATYDEEVNIYLIKWLDWDGTELKTETLPYGATPTAPANPERSSDGENRYTFKGWDVEAVPVTGNATYQAMYEGERIGYVITWVDDEDHEIRHEEHYYNDHVSFSGGDPVKESTAQYDYTFVGWKLVGGDDTIYTSTTLPVVKANATYKAQFSSTLRSYTVTWLDWNNDLLLKETLDYGEMPSYTGTAPTRDPDAQYTYTHSGWTPAMEAVTGNVTYTATYSGVLNKYTVTWLDWNGTELKKETLPYGATPTAPADPSRPNDGKYTYTFKGWNAEIKTVTGNVTYQARYDGNLIGYTIIWVDDADHEIHHETHYYGDKPIFSGSNPVKASTAQYDYTFTGWKLVGGDDSVYTSMTLPNVTGNATYKAQFESKVRSYTVTWQNWDGTQFYSETLLYGAIPSYSGATPTRAADAEFTYTHNGWTPVIEPVSGNVTYTATYSTVLNEYTVTWLDWNGTELKKETLLYGAMPAAPATPTRADDGKYSYSFNKWNVPIAEVTGNAAYQAIYTATLIGYTVTWVDDADLEIRQEGHYYGEKPIFSGTAPTKASTAQYDYTFTGWKLVGGDDTIYTSTTLPDVTGNATYKAQFQSILRVYTVTWKNENGTVLAEEAYAYGELPEYFGTTPTKAADAEFTYTHSGWTPSVVTVTGDATYIAAYSSTVNTYTVQWVDWNGTVLKTETLPYGTMPTAPADPTRPDNNEHTYTFDKWDMPIVQVTGNATYQALYTSDDVEYTITWVHENGTTIHEEIHYYGDHVFYTGAVPTKAADVQYTYTFSGWKHGASDALYPSDGLPTVTEDATYVAQFDSTLRAYEVTWLDENGSVLKTEEVSYGTLPAFGATPTKAADVQYTYSFSGWTPVVEAVSGDATYTATYSGVLNKYTVTWLDWDGSVIHEEQVAYGTLPAAPADPTRAATEEYAYIFQKWDVPITAVTGDAVYQALYTAEAIGYTITWVDDNNNLLQQETRNYGAKPVYSVVPTKAADAEFTYSFTGWKLVGGGDTLYASTELPIVTKNATYQAQFSSTARKYTVTWQNEDGTVLKTEQLVYGATPSYTGATPTKAADVQYTYTFSGWTPTVEAVSGDVTYTATYSGVLNKYMVSWLDWDSSVIHEEQVAYGTLPAAPADPTRAATAEYTFTFDGWDVPITEVTGNAVYQALYTAKPIGYTITWVDDNGNQLHEETRYYGAKPVYSTDPVKEADAEFTYTFTGWKLVGGDDTLYPSLDLPVVTQNATYQAQFAADQRSYHITWLDEDGTILRTDHVPYGQTPVYGAAPSKAADAQYTYVFDSWMPSVTAVTGPATYRATYLGTLKTYTVKWIDWDGTVLKAESLPYGTMPTAPADPERAAAGGHAYTFAGWDVPAVEVTGDATYQAMYTSAPIGYTITWVDENGTQLRQEMHYYGGKPVYSGGDPVKPATAQYTYSFEGWKREGDDNLYASDDLPTVTADTTYQAQFSSKVREYTIIWRNDDGATIQTEQVKYGVTPTFVGMKPTKASTAEFSYVFEGWSPNVTAVTGNATYTATYTAVRRSYKVTWQNEDGTELLVDTVEYGSMPAYTGATPTKAGTGRHTYTHSGWTTPLQPVTGDVTYIAAFTMHVNRYTITWKDEDGTVLRTDSVPYGEVPSYGAAPEKTGNAQYSYVFSGWNPDVVAVTEDAAYTATYTQQVNKYTVTWLNDDGTVLKTEQVAYGAMPAAPGNPTKQPDAQFTYTFSGWDSEPVKVVADATYTATYSTTVNTYTVIWINWNDTVLETDADVPYGTVPTYDGPAPAKPATDETVYIWNKWDKTVDPVTGNITYKAVFVEQGHTYTIIWKNYDGTVLEIDSDVACGEMPSYDGATPVRDSDVQFSYTFSDWTPALTAVSGDAEYVAAFAQTVNSYTVTYTDGVAGVEIFADQSYTAEYGSQVPLFVGTPARDGYTFGGWSPAVQLTVTGNVTYTARWNQNTPAVPVVPPVLINGAAKLIKVDADDQNTRLKGVVFELYRADGTYLGSAETDADGVITVQALTPGKYFWIETRPAEGYVLDSTKHSFTVVSGNTVTTTVTNTRSDVPTVFSGEHYAYIVGYNDGTVRPEANITRAEVATIFFRLLDQPTRDQYMTKVNSFSDVEPGMWFNTAVSTMAAMGIVSGYPNGEFHPNENITRAEFAAIAARFDADGNTTGASFKDVYDHWAKKEIAIAANNGWVLGYEDDTFRPDQYITRAEAMAMVNRVLQRIPETKADLLGTMVKWPDNKDTTKWYYLTVQEATNSHDYGRKKSGYEYWTAIREVPDWSALER